MNSKIYNPLLLIFICCFSSYGIAQSDGDIQSKIAWPMPKFYFSVDMGNGMEKIAFQEISGLEMENQIIEYRHGDSPIFSTTKMPGLVKSGNVTMKKGVFKDNPAFWEWYGKIKMNTIERKYITIQLLDEQGISTMTWTLSNAFPIKISGSDLKNDGNEIAIESIDFAHEGITITNGG